VDLSERSGMFKFDFASVRDELNEWASRRATLAVAALRMFVMKRESSAARSAAFPPLRG
jgi:hypothetical protein